MSWKPGGASLYGAVPARPPSTRITGYDERGSVLFALAFMGGIGFFAFALVALAGVLLIRRARLPKGWSTQPALVQAQTTGRGDLERLRHYDPDFSLVLFEDFVYALYAEAHTARGAGRLEELSPFVRAAARAELARFGPVPVTTVVVGSMRYTSAQVSPATGAVVGLEIEANYSEANPAGSPQSYWTVERWELARGPHARSRPPDRVRVFACPSCGAPLDRVMGGRCQYCQQVVDSGAFDWVVERVSVVDRQARPPMLTGTTEEQGTELPTILDAYLAAARQALAQRDPAFTEQSLLARVALIFSTMQTAWSTLQWNQARPYLSDNLWTAQTYWIDAYRKSGLRNRTDNAKIHKVELCRISSDRWYDAITVRVFATSLDYTVRESDGAVVGGSSTKERAYTEYWTLIRGTGARGPARSDPVCPSCGAPLAINAAGHCNHCQAKLTAGQFDWVLSRIEQDEVYAG